jgi:hypothetical protein
VGREGNLERFSGELALPVVCMAPEYHQSVSGRPWWVEAAWASSLTVGSWDSRGVQRALARRGFIVSPGPGPRNRLRRTTGVFAFQVLVECFDTSRTHGLEWESTASLPLGHQSATSLPAGRY